MPCGNVKPCSTAPVFFHKSQVCNDHISVRELAKKCHQDFWLHVNKTKFICAIQWNDVIVTSAAVVANANDLHEVKDDNFKCL